MGESHNRIISEESSEIDSSLLKNPDGRRKNGCKEWFRGRFSKRQD